MSIRVLVADYEEVFVAGVREFLAGTEIELIAWASCGPKAVSLALEHAPHVVLLSAHLGNGNFITTLNQIKQSRPEIAVVVTASSRHPSQMALCHAAGAAGWLLRDFNCEKLRKTIRRVAAGERVWNREEIRRIAGVRAAHCVEAATDIPLTPREADVLRHMTLGGTNRQIAEELGISHETVKEYVQCLLTKIGVEDRTQAAIWATRRGLA